MGKKMAREDVIKECFARLSHKYPKVDWSSFDFETYVSIPRGECIKPVPEGWNVKRLYARHKMVVDFITQQLGYGEYLKMKDEYN